MIVAQREAYALVGSLFPLEAYIAQPLRAGRDLQKGRLGLTSHCLGEKMRPREAEASQRHTASQRQT